MTMIQLNPPIPLDTSKGKGFAHVLIDYGQEHNLIWVVFIDDTHECWCIPNPEIRIQKNWSYNRRELGTKIKDGPSSPCQMKPSQ